jgi:hypothetical protein
MSIRRYSLNSFFSNDEKKNCDLVSRCTKIIWLKKKFAALFLNYLQHFLGGKTCQKSRQEAKIK